MSKKLFAAFILGLGLTLGLLWLLGGGLSARAASLTVDTTDDELNSDGDCSLREAIQAANTDAAVDGCTAGSGDDTITLPAGVYTLTITGANEDSNLTGDLDITGTLTIIGAGPDRTIINANHIDRAFDIQYGVSAVVISGVTIFDGYTYLDNGGGIDNHWGADLTLTNTVVLSNAAYAPSWGLAVGGGIAHSGSALTLTNVSILSNTAAGRGGGLYIADSSAVLSGTMINYNSVTGSPTDKGGGGLYVKDSRVTLRGGQIASNTSEYHGGGIHIRESSSFTQTGDTLIAHNVASVSDGSGGGVYVYSSNAILGAARILSNTAKTGGGVYVAYGSATLSGTHIISNYAKSGGGLIGGRASLYRVYILSNTANDYGGGIYNGAQMSVDATTLSGNRANRDGGGIYNSGTMTITNSTLSGNYATAPGSDGGALTNDGGAITLTFTTIVSNTTDRCGGGICVFNDGNVWMQNTLLAYNRVRGVITNCNTSLSSGDHITSTGHNLEDADTCGLTATGDQPNTDPLLGPLADNGGDTLTHALLDGSPAIDAAACVAGITTDQRGAARPQGVSCDIGAYEYNQAPVADAGPDQSVDRLAEVTLDGSASSDPDGDYPLAYLWTQTGGPAVSFTPGISITTFTAPSDPAVLTFTLAVTDSLGLPDPTPDEVVITIANQAPAVDAGSDQTVDTDAAVTLDGSGSSDPDGDYPLAYLWTQTGGPAVSFTPNISVTAFTAPSAPAVLTFTLAVTDSLGLPDPTPDEVVVAVQQGEYRIYLPLVLRQ